MEQISLIERDLKHLWHPCGQMKDYEKFKPLVVSGAQGSYIELATGQKIIDANSSWWCKSLGHNHPRLKQALFNQIDKFEHVILANTTNETITQLSEKLCSLSPHLQKVFYAGDGSSAVEIALKMSLHARMNQGEVQRTQFISLSNSFHGETTGALSVSDVGLYKTPYRYMVFDAYFIDPLPYVNSTSDLLWQNCEVQWEVIEEKLKPFTQTATALIVEPILQAAGSMRVYSQDFLRRLRQWSRQHGVHLIADEIMTGLGRTGKMLACDYAQVEPDFLCLGKGLTAGWMPFSAVLTTNAIYQNFYADYAQGKTFFHSHTFSGNPLAASIALEVLQVIADTDLCAQAMRLENYMAKAMQEIADETGVLTNVRHIGAMVAADLIVSDPQQRMGFEIYQKAVQLGALLRPLGNTIYWVPPLNTTAATIDELKDITLAAITAVLANGLAA